MDNNFDENKPVSEEELSGTTPVEPSSEPQPADSMNQQEQNLASANQPEQNSTTADRAEQNIPTSDIQQTPQNHAFSQQPAQGFPGGGFTPYPPPYHQYVPNMNIPGQGGAFPPPQASVNNQYVPNAGGPFPPPQVPQKKKLSGSWFWTLLISIILLVAIAVVLSVMIARQMSGMKKLTELEKEFQFDPEQETVEHVIVDIPTYRKPVLEEEFYQDADTGLLTTVGVAQVVLPSQVKIEIFDDLPYLPVGSGSGIIISSDGYIVTNAHVVDGAEHLSVKFYDDSSSEAVVIGMDRKSDLAVIKVSRDDLTPAEIGTSADLVIGEEIAIAGAGGGFENTVTYGHVTGLDREINTSYISSSAMHCIQTDAALNPGNSGGALVNMYGQVVGVAVALMNHETYENIGFSIAIDDAVPIIEELIANGYVSSRSRVGISYLTIGDSLASSYEVMPGLCITEIDPKSAVAATDIELYDIIVQIDNVRVFGGDEVAEALAGKVPGDTVQLMIFRRSVTGKNTIFEVPVELIPDTESVSGYSESISSEDFYRRGVIN